MEGLDTSLLLAIAEHLRKNRNALMGSRWRSCECETIAAQTIVACDYNFRENKDAFSWVGENVMHNDCRGHENYTALRTLLEEGSLVMEEYQGALDHPSGTHLVDETPQILRVTNKLLQYIFDTHLK